MLVDALRLLASWHSFSEWELILVLSAGTVLAVLALNFLVDAGLELWDRVISIHGGPHAVDSARIHRETVAEVERLSARATSGPSVRGVPPSAVGVSTLPTAGDGGARFYDEADYGRSTSLVHPVARERRGVAVSPWLAGRDL